MCVNSPEEQQADQHHQHNHVPEPNEYISLLIDNIQWQYA